MNYFKFSELKKLLELVQVIDALSEGLETPHILTSSNNIYSISFIFVVVIDALSEGLETPHIRTSKSGPKLQNN